MASIVSNFYYRVYFEQAGEQHLQSGTSAAFMEVFHRIENEFRSNPGNTGKNCVGCIIHVHALFNAINCLHDQNTDAAG